MSLTPVQQQSLQNHCQNARECILELFNSFKISEIVYAYLTEVRTFIRLGRDPAEICPTDTIREERLVDIIRTKRGESYEHFHPLLLENSIGVFEDYNLSMVLPDQKEGILNHLEQDRGDYVSNDPLLELGNEEIKKMILEELV